MPTYRVMVARLAVSGWHRAEVADFCLYASQHAHDNPLIGGIVHSKFGQTPAPVARNAAVAEAQRENIDVLVMIDDDMVVPGAFFGRACSFLFSHHGPAAIGVPYVCGGQNQRVQVFEWTTQANGAREHGFRSSHIPREDAARRTGIEQVLNIGTGCVAYNLSAFAKIAPPHFDYRYTDQTHSVLAETEDFYCHRKLYAAHVPVFVDWDSWAGHVKESKLSKPAIVSREEIDEIWLAQAGALLNSAKPLTPDASESDSINSAFNGRPIHVGQ